MFNISSLFSGDIFISSIFLELASVFKNFSAILFPINALVVSAVWWILFGGSFCRIKSCFCSSIQNIFPIFVELISCKSQKSICFDVFSCSWFYRITHHFCSLISHVNLALSSISNAFPFWSVNVMIVYQTQYYKFSKTLNCLVQHLTN